MAQDLRLGPLHRRQAKDPLPTAARLRNRRRRAVDENSRRWILLIRAPKLQTSSQLDLEFQPSGVAVAHVCPRGAARRNPEGRGPISDRAAPVSRPTSHRAAAAVL